MHFSTALAATALAGSALAADHSVKVGGNDGELTFTPNNVNASQGDTVTFHFWPKNHSVAESTFAKPCEPKEDAFWSGYIPSTSGGAMETFVIEVQNDDPIWFYCTQGKHCSSGMVGAINAPSTGNTVENFTSKAMEATTIEAPTSVKGTGGKLENMTMSASGSGSAASSTSSPGAASSLEVGGLAFSGVLGMFAYLLL